MKQTPNPSRPDNRKRRTLAVLLALTCVLTLPLGACGPNDADQAVGSPETSATTPDPVEEGKLSLIVKAEDWDESSGSITVNVTGKPEDGDSLTAVITATPDKPLELTYDPGFYTFATDSITKGETVYGAAETSASFTGTDDKTVTLSISKDTAATEALAQQKAAEEQARRRPKRRRRHAHRQRPKLKPKPKLKRNAKKPKRPRRPRSTNKPSTSQGPARSTTKAGAVASARARFPSRSPRPRRWATSPARTATNSHSTTARRTHTHRASE